MKITGLKVYQVDLPLHEGQYSWSEGKSVDVFDSTVVELETDDGAEGIRRGLSRSVRSTFPPTPRAPGSGSRRSAPS